jgi:hypothetical protein
VKMTRNNAHWSPRALPHQLVAALLASFVFGCVGNASFAADPGSYCVAFARQDANNKTGLTDEGADASDERWLGAYNKAFAACMENYQPSPSSEDVASKARREPKPRASGALESAPKLTKQKQASELSKSPRLHGTRGLKAASSHSRSKPRARGQSLCRRLQVDKAGAYHIINCRPGH